MEKQSRNKIYRKCPKLFPFGVVQRIQQQGAVYIYVILAQAVAHLFVDRIDDDVMECNDVTALQSCQTFHNLLNQRDLFLREKFEKWWVTYERNGQ